MNSNMLNLNKDKTKFSSQQHVKKTMNLRIKAICSYINSSLSVNNLGHIFDSSNGEVGEFYR